MIGHPPPKPPREDGLGGTLVHGTRDALSCGVGASHSPGRSIAVGISEVGAPTPSTERETSMSDTQKPQTISGYRRRALRSAMAAIKGHCRETYFMAQVEQAIARGERPESAIAQAMADVGLFGRTDGLVRPFDDERGE